MIKKRVKTPGTEKATRITRNAIYLSDEVYWALKQIAVQKRITIREYVDQVIKDAVSRARVTIQFPVFNPSTSHHQEELELCAAVSAAVNAPPDLLDKHNITHGQGWIMLPTKEMFVFMGSTHTLPEYVRNPQHLMMRIKSSAILHERFKITKTKVVHGYAYYKYEVLGGVGDTKSPTLEEQIP